MTLWRVVTLAVAISAAALTSGCHDDYDDVPTVGPVDHHTGPRTAARVPLTETTVEEFLKFVASSSGYDLEYVRAEIDGARDNRVILEHMLEVLRRAWPPERSPSAIGGQVSTIVAVIKQLRSELAEPLLHEMTWRALPPPSGDPFGPRTVVEWAEIATVEALVCVPGYSAVVMVDEIIASHPSESVREAAQRQRTRMDCRF